MKPICLPYEDAFDEDYQIDKTKGKLETWVAGWGAIDPKGKYKFKSRLTNAYSFLCYWPKNSGTVISIVIYAYHT